MFIKCNRLNEDEIEKKRKWRERKKMRDKRYESNCVSVCCLNGKLAEHVNFVSSCYANQALDTDIMISTIEKQIYYHHHQQHQNKNNNIYKSMCKHAFN